MEREIEVLSGGEEVPLNSFARRIVLNTLMGLLTSLRDVDPEREIRVTVRPVGTAPRSGPRNP